MVIRGLSAMARSGAGRVGSDWGVDLGAGMVCSDGIADCGLKGEGRVHRFRGMEEEDRVLQDGCCAEGDQQQVLCSL